MQTLQGIQRSKINRDCRTLIEILAAYIIDGDTFAVGPSRYRLWGIDAPEISTWRGEVARDKLADIIEGRRLYCIEKDQDKWGRRVVQCYTDQGADIGCIMVSQGAATDWPRFSGGYYRNCAAR